MLELSVQCDGEPARTVCVTEFPCRIGRQKDRGLCLPSWRVGRVHAELRRMGPALVLADCGTLGGTVVNGERISEHGPLAVDDEIRIGGFTLRVLRVGHVDGADKGMASEPEVRAEGATAPPAPRAPVLATDAQASETPAWMDARRELHRRLLARLDLRRQEVRHLSTEALGAALRAQLLELIEADHAFSALPNRDRLIDELIDEAVGLGPLERLLADPSITEIMVNGIESIYVERNGKLEASAVRFSSAEAIRSVIERIVVPLGRRIDESSPMVDARLADGSRVNAIIPPLAIKGPTITIRRFNARVFEPEDLVRQGSASADMLSFLDICVRTRQNILVSGGTGSGKTTLLNLLSNLIDPGERIVTVEDAAELRLRHPHLVALEARPRNAEGRGEVTIRDLVRNALRMRPDRIIVGECRGGEALDMLQAMNTGHDGSLTTVHANSPRDVVARLEVMVLMAGVDIPVPAIRDQIASAVDVVVQQARLPDGSRRIVEIAEITGVEGGRIQMQPLFRFERRFDAAGRVGGRFVSCGHMPTFFEQLADEGRPVTLDCFSRGFA
ncbi:MAG: Flp pilus assembly complex ATPase component TadA [Burkholderiaceae bacterium]|nr:Flp pilus assembly complex ATPase component TadA [Burkholderiaceae bacterium]